MPWSAKARELIQRQYAPVGAAGESSLEGRRSMRLEQSPAVEDLAPTIQAAIGTATEIPGSLSPLLLARHSLADYRLAPFHLLASEGAVHVDKSNGWHMETLHRLAAADPDFILATPFLEIDLGDEAAWNGAANGGRS